MAHQGVLIETDILIDFLTAPAGAPSLLRLLLAELPCYTTFIQAAELYSCAHNSEEKHKIEPALFGLRVLGASARYAATMGELMRQTAEPQPLPLREICTAAIAIEAHLPVITKKFLENYRRILHLPIIEADIVRQLIRHSTLRSHVEALCADKARSRIS